MPLYEYACTGCETKFDALRSMAEADAPIECPNCGSEDTKRAISLFCAIGDSGVIADSGSACSSCSPSSSCASCSAKR
jgi:putative FmdB family regulatory protein